jgi:hypothetical protein
MKCWATEKSNEVSSVTREYAPKVAGEMKKTVTERVPQGAGAVCNSVSQGCYSYIVLFSPMALARFWDYYYF